MVLCASLPQELGNTAHTELVPAQGGHMEYLGMWTILDNVGMWKPGQSGYVGIWTMCSCDDKVGPWYLDM